MTLRLLQLAQWLLLRLPWPVVRRLGTGLGLLWFHVLRYRRSLVEENLAAALRLERHDPEVRRIARANFVHYGLLVVEILCLRRVIEGGVGDSLEISGIEHLDRAREKGKGVLVLTAHVGNYDLLAVAAGISGYPMSFVSKKVKNKQIEAFWMSERKAAGVRIFTLEDSARDLLRSLKRNEYLGIILDQHAARGAVWVEYFGRPASTLRLLAVLAERSGAPVVPVFTHRLKDGRHRVEVQPPIEFEACATRDESAVHNTQRYTAAIESAVRSTPEQWTWIHKRWKPRPSQSTGES